MCTEYTIVIECNDGGRHYVSKTGPPLQLPSYSQRGEENEWRVEGGEVERVRKLTDTIVMVKVMRD